MPLNLKIKDADTRAATPSVYAFIPQKSPYFNNMRGSRDQRRSVNEEAAGEPAYRPSLHQTTAGRKHVRRTSDSRRWMREHSSDAGGAV